MVNRMAMVQGEVVQGELFESKLDLFLTSVFLMHAVGMPQEIIHLLVQAEADVCHF